jgi:hypothetical protein
MVAVREGLETWRGEGCCAAPQINANAAPGGCHDDCCASDAPKATDNGCRD